MTHHLREPVGARSAARPSRPTVVLLHASGGSSRQWDALAEQLRPGFDVHAIDLHGHGRQAPWSGRRPLSLHDDAALALPAIEGAGGAHLIGHSYGGAVAMHLAAARPWLVRSMAVYEPALFGLLAEREPQSLATCEISAVAEDLRATMAAGHAAAAAERFIDYWSGDGSFARLGPTRQEPIVQRMPSVMRHFDALHAAPPSWPPLARLDVPLLCLTGADSTTVCRRIGKLLQALLPRAKHETLAGMAHMGPMTHAAQVNLRLLRFLGIDAAAPLRASPRTPLTLAAPEPSLAA